MDKELLYNASGAKDETAYKAIINVMKGNNDMGVMGVKKGEVWEVESGVATRHVVVIKCFEDYAATIMLQDNEPKESSVQVIARGVTYADAGRLGWVFYDKFVNYVRSLTAEEDKYLRQAVGAALELEVNKVSAVTAAAALEARDEARQELEELRKELKAKAEELEEAYEHMEANARQAEEAERRAEAAEAAVAHQGTVELIEDYSLREDLAAARKEAEIYKGLYEAMLQRALG